ncbi:MAG TPA: asparagine synthase C-terminal domain-containing protein [Kiritimatiellia bacterium]|nr:asparagine synthase C-terminal domain-containing protein [Kiritimatiellia bacterium]
MALLVMLYDVDPERRHRCIDGIIIDPLPNQDKLLTHEWSAGNWHLLARHAPSTPWKQSETPGQFHVIIGKLLDDALNSITPGTNPAIPLNGFGASLSINTQSPGLIAHTDFMGTFPLYYAEGRDWAMISSSPWMFRHHPDFSPQWDTEGLVSLLLSMHLVTGQTVWKGVRRVQAGSRLNWDKQSGFRETQTYVLTKSEKNDRDVTDAIADRLIHIMDAWRDPAVPDAILLSGGLDSRLLAGLLRSRTNREVTAYTNGYDTDLDVQCARRVAERLNFRHHVWEYPDRDYLDTFKTATRLELASNGVSSGNMFIAYKTITPGSQVTAGYCLDCLMQSTHYYESRLSRPYSEKGVIELYGRWGFSSEIVERLIPGATTREAIQKVRDHQHAFFEFRQSTDLLETALLYEYYFRQRHHIAGMLWRLSFGSWPVVPALDAPLSEMIMSVSSENRTFRKIEKDILCRRFPHLARVPLDGNDASPKSLLPNHWWNKLADRARGWEPAEVPPVTGRQQLRYYRTLDINNPAWRKVRGEIESLRVHLHDIFDPVTLSELWPGPEANVAMQRPIPESAIRKTLLGLAVIGASMKK